MPDDDTDEESDESILRRVVHSTRSKLDEERFSDSLWESLAEELSEGEASSAEAILDIIERGTIQEEQVEGEANEAQES